ncbi:TIGR03790 family protein [Paucibacter sp. APW11]|uniref:TIGR03790 family protein n=1 Tax=Roseateles aquae TaxID=3077235 RepID=A0ABU3P7J1_9BURK|nr:TIGR03790 family protein [Paucibacter sp. APW11]MDT8998552.1 TIGR03790 family protein [Paucibacter sp. APW11]
MSATSSPAAASAAGTGAPWVAVPRLTTRLQASELGVVINQNDPLSVALGEYYIRRRGIAAEQVLRVEVPLKPALSFAEFEALREKIQTTLGSRVQALALVWSQPYAVECNSITAALAIGFQGALCQQSCAPSRPSPMFNSASSRPHADLGVLPAMLLAARSLEAGKALIERGIAADGSAVAAERRPGSVLPQAYFLSSDDKARNVRAALFPRAGVLAGMQIRQQPVSAEPLPNALLLSSGQMRVEGLDKIGWLPGALADHLTSFGGRLDAPPQSAQMSAIEWLDAGATASYGTVSEPCNHLQKFPHPQVLLLHYLQGATALEAYWRSVAWPGQGVFIGEPLAAPFAAVPPRAASAVSRQ